MNADTLGDLFRRKDGSVWRQVTFTDKPTVCLEQVVEADWQTGIVRPMQFGQPRMDVVVGSLISKEFTRLVEET